MVEEAREETSVGRSACLLRRATHTARTRMRRAVQGLLCSCRQRRAPPALRALSTSPDSLLSRLQRSLTEYYTRDCDPCETVSLSEQARQELRWLETAVRAKTGGTDWQRSLADMVSDIVERDKPLAYVLGAFVT